MLKSWYPGGEVTTTVHPVEVVDGHAVVTLDFALGSDGKRFTLGISIEADPDRMGSGGVRLVDLGSDRVWTAGYDSEGVPAATQGRLYLEPGESVTTVTMFSVPDVDRVDVFVPGVGLVRDVPVVDGGSDAPSMASLELSGEVTFPEAAQLRTYTQSYLDGVSVSGRGEEQTVTLASDVLFDTDKYDLTDGAMQVVNEAVAAIKSSAGGGEVRVVGHTDDVLSEEYNLDLSNKRAETVADRLGQDLGDGFTIVSEGKGESQPAVPGTDAEARAANRRVEIRFTATEPVGFEGSAIPEAQVPVSFGNEPVIHQCYMPDKTISVSVADVVRRDGYLVGTFSVSLVDGYGEQGVRQWFGNGYRTSNYIGNLDSLDRTVGAWPLHLLTDSGRVFPAQYSSSWGGREKTSFLTDRLVVNYTPLERVFTYDVVWPDPGTDSISVESEGCFRIVDIPVEDE